MYNVNNTGVMPLFYKIPYAVETDMNIPIVAT